MTEDQTRELKIMSIITREHAAGHITSREAAELSMGVTVKLSVTPWAVAVAFSVGYLLCKAMEVGVRL